MILMLLIRLSTGKLSQLEAGDVFAKAEVRLLEMYESISIIEQCLDGLEKEKGGRYYCKGQGDT